MFCNQCGASLPEGSKFCPHCGTKMTAAPAAAKSQPAPRAAKKKAPIWLTAVVVVAAFLLGKFLIAPSMLSEPDSTEGSTEGSSVIQIEDVLNSGTETDIPAANPAYDAILTDAYIVHFQPFFMMETESFVMKQEDGIICCADYGYEEDVVKQWVETIYMPVAEYTDAQKAELEATMKTQFEVLDALSCCSVGFQMGANYLTITCTYSDVDGEESCTELYNAGILGANTFISMSATQESLLNQGFVKK